MTSDVEKYRAAVLEALAQDIEDVDSTLPYFRGVEAAIKIVATTPLPGAVEEKRIAPDGELERICLLSNQVARHERSIAALEETVRDLVVAQLIPITLPADIESGAAKRRVAERGNDLIAARIADSANDKKV